MNVTNFKTQFNLFANENIKSYIMTNIVQFVSLITPYQYWLKLLWRWFIFFHSSNKLFPGRCVFASCGLDKTSNRRQVRIKNHPVHWYLISSPLDKMAAISQTDDIFTFLRVLPWMKIFVFWVNFHWSLLRKVQLTITQHWFILWLGAE